MRRIALFVEGDTERGDARRKTLPTFFHKWLDPQLPEGARVGISAVNFRGVSNFLDDLPKTIRLYLNERRANFVVGLVDLYGLPPDRIDLSGCASIKEKVSVARQYIRNLVPAQFRDRFRQHFAVHEVEAWLLAYPEKWPAGVRDQTSSSVGSSNPEVSRRRRTVSRTCSQTAGSRSEPTGSGGAFTIAKTGSWAAHPLRAWQASWAHR